MERVEFTVQKAHMAVRISEELLSDVNPSGPPPKPTFRWPSFICGYEHSDDYYSEGHACELPVDHDGPHRCSLEWDTRPSDICRSQGHEWGDWKPLSAADATLAGARMMSPSALRLRDPFERKAPTKERRCARCEARETDAEYDLSLMYRAFS